MEKNNVQEKPANDETLVREVKTKEVVALMQFDD